jgi:processive 1,2-diacylglycerol beta-glucosyltransferase
MMFGVWSILKADPNQLANRLSELETPIASGASDSTGTRGSAASVSDRDQARSTSATTEQLHIKLENVWIWFWIVLALHSIPLAFFYVNVFPTNKRWTRILSIRGTLSLFDNLKESSAPKLIPSGKIRLINNETNELVGEVSHEQLGFLIENFEEESALDDAYYIQKATLEMLERNESDSDLIRLLRKAIGKKEGIEVRWERG